MRDAVFLDGKLGRRRWQVKALDGLVYLQDDKSKQQFLVDTGAAVSVLPYKDSSPLSGPWDSVTRSLSFRMRTFLCTLILWLARRRCYAAARETRLAATGVFLPKTNANASAALDIWLWAFCRLQCCPPLSVPPRRPKIPPHHWP